MKFLSTKVHAVLGILVGIVLIVAPNIFSFTDAGGAANNIPRVIGVLIILAELTTNNGLAPFDWISMKTHLMTDYLFGLFLALSPWLFGFHDNGTNAWLPHVVVGVALLLVTAVTRTVPDRERAAA